MDGKKRWLKLQFKTCRNRTFVLMIFFNFKRPLINCYSDLCQALQIENEKNLTTNDFAVIRVREATGGLIASYDSLAVRTCLIRAQLKVEKLVFHVAL